MSHISFSELKYWAKCPHYHKVNYIDGVSTFNGNLFTAFGKAIHHVCEKIILGKVSQSDASDEFKHKFFNEVEKLSENEALDQDLFESMVPQGVELAKYAIPELREYFGDFTLVGVEENLYEKIQKAGLEIGDKNFKGFIDLIIKTPDGKYHIVDWKSCGWGWKAEQKTDKMTTYQLTLYKHFYSQKHNIDSSKIETYFALLKRTAKENKVEIFRVTSGPRKTDNALNLLHKALYNIEKKNFVKNRLACRFCELYKTEYCT